MDYGMHLKKGYNEEINESKIDFYEFVHSVGAMSYVYSRNCEKILLL